MRRAYHTPQGDPCKFTSATGGVCGLLPHNHRVGHAPQGDPCIKCGLGVGHHEKPRSRSHSERSYYVGIDGEGQGRHASNGGPDDPGHRYVMLAWCSEDRHMKGAIEAPPGGRLTTVECLDFILSIPNRAKIFSYAFNYDLTKILEDVDDGVLYRLFRPDERRRNGGPEEQRKGPRPVYWGGYSLNLQGSKFSVAKGRGKAKVRRVIWDIFKFYQSAFVKALEDWFTKEDRASKLRVWVPPHMGPVVEHMRMMKENRANFDKLTRAEILDYCYDECAYMGQLAHKLVDAHDEAGLSLTSYYGAGSTASALLKSMGIDKEVRTGPPAMDKAVGMAFFGGRFENRVIGVIRGPLHGYDISSAYPYQITFLPCLGCGRWEKTKNRKDLEGATTALVRYTFEGPTPEGLTWGPFPFRHKTGSICFPVRSGGGYVWLDEFLQGERLFPHVRFARAWVYRTDCGHAPFAKMPHYYRERLRIGKEGAGIVFKLGPNASYGKTAQSKGVAPPFQSWIWAGMITSGTRAQILELMGLHKDPSNMLMVATDGVYTREKLVTPEPRDTGTGPEHTRDPMGNPVNKPLGGWEYKKVKGDMFAARPGIYFPMNPTEQEIKDMRARGVGRKTLFESWKMLVDGFEAGQATVDLPNVVRFWGAKSSIGRVEIPGLPGQYKYTRFVDEKTGRVRYGQWQEREVKMSFNPAPKRKEIEPDGSLSLWSFSDDYVSAQYKNTLESADAKALKAHYQEMLEQPDPSDFADYDE